MLPAVDEAHVCGAFEMLPMRVCHSGLAVRGVERDEVAAAVAGEEHAAGRREHAGAAAAAGILDAARRPCRSW